MDRRGGRSPVSRTRRCTWAASWGDAGDRYEVDTRTSILRDVRACGGRGRGLVGPGAGRVRGRVPAAWRAAAKPAPPGLRAERKGCEPTPYGVLMFSMSEGASPQGKHRKTHPMRGWRNRQTRWIQVPVPARAWGFNSPLAHNEIPMKRVSVSDEGHGRGPFLVVLAVVRDCTSWTPYATPSARDLSHGRSRPSRFRWRRFLTGRQVGGCAQRPGGTTPTERP